jgi:hypothetical protein
MEAPRQHADSASWEKAEGAVDRFIDRQLASIRSKTWRRLARVIFLIVVTWVPILLLSLASKHAFKGVVDVPLLQDPSSYGRFLFVLPLLELAEIVVALSLAVQSRQFVDSDIVPESERAHFYRAMEKAIRLRSSGLAETTIAVLAFVVSITARMTIRLYDQSTWVHDGKSITPAGWWYTAVSLPILLFFLLRWVYVYGLWSWFLFRVSKLELELTPTHPDHAGGLGFIGWGLVCFSSVLTAVSAVFSAGFAYEIIHRNQSLDSLKYHVIVFVVLALAVLYAPLVVFSGKLSRCRFRGLLDYSSLVLRHDRAFDKKWIENPSAATNETLLGSSDIQSAADIATVYEHVYEMRLVPFDAKAFAVVMVSVLLPMIPLIATVVPLNEIFAKLFELVA